MILMKDVNCYGIIPLKWVDEEWHVLLIKHVKGNYWAFPKGHGEGKEEPLESATRELLEETGLNIVKLLSSESLCEHYNFVARGEQIHKSVTYFIAEVEGVLSLQKDEIIDAKWVPLVAAESEMTFKEGKNICRRTIQLVG